MTKSRIKIIAIIFLVVASIGFLDATYLTVEHYRGGVPPCTILSGCEVVLTSAYNQVINIPVALLGSIFYLAMLVASISYIDSRNIKLLRLGSHGTIAGMFATLYFVYLQFFVIHHVCIYCMTSAVTSTTLFVLGMIILSKTQKVEIEI
jgi:uncharacterized membrane protein